jgi:hypothetical protein
MAKLKCFSIAGVDLWFWSNDHGPPHFHAKIEGAWEVAVHFLEPEVNMFKIKWQKRPFSAHHRKTLVQKVTDHRNDLVNEWGEKVRSQ